MERYYRILGIPSTASKEEIKKAYYHKMQALHLDKVHGTPLEDTATFFATEINEAYSTLMSESCNHYTSYNEKNKNEYIEEEIFIEILGTLKYSLSNDLNKILNAIIKRTENKNTINSFEWRPNMIPSENIKRTMNKHDMNYSMTAFQDGPSKKVIIFKREKNNWYITGYEVHTGYSE